MLDSNVSIYVPITNAAARERIENGTVKDIRVEVKGARGDVYVKAHPSSIPALMASLETMGLKCKFAPFQKDVKGRFKKGGAIYVVGA